jgi:hypothetical protein
MKPARNVTKKKKKKKKKQAKSRRRATYIDSHLAKSHVSIVALLVDLLERRSRAILVVPRDLIRRNATVAAALRIDRHRANVGDRQRLLTCAQLQYTRCAQRRNATQTTLFRAQALT